MESKISKNEDEIKSNIEVEFIKFFVSDKYTKKDRIEDKIILIELILKPNIPVRILSKWIKTEYIKVIETV